MASYRRPKGTVTRPIPDWKFQSLGFGGIFNAFAGTHEQIVGLMNFDTSGNSLFVWDCTISVGKNTAANIALSQGIFWYIAQVPDPGPGARTPVMPNDPTVAAPLGWVANDISIANLVFFNPGYVPLSGEGVWTWDRDFPMCRIPPGFTHIVDATLVNGALGVGWVCELAPFP